MLQLVYARLLRYGKRSRCCARRGESLDLRLRILDAVDKVNVDRHQLRCQCEIKAKVKDDVMRGVRYNDSFCEQPPNPNDTVSRSNERGPFHMLEQERATDK